MGRIEREFEGRYRLRWSPRKGEWHLEQKCGRAADPPCHISEGDDTLIRARDGYWFVLAIRPGDRMPCPGCGQTIKVPVLEFGEATCEWCQRHGKDGRYPAAYFPLDSDRLLEHIRRLDKIRGDHRVIIQMVEEANDLRNKRFMNDKLNEVDAISEDQYKRLFNIPSVGYTGKEKYQE